MCVPGLGAAVAGARPDDHAREDGVRGLAHARRRAPRPTGRDPVSRVGTCPTRQRRIAATSPPAASREVAPHDKGHGRPRPALHHGAGDARRRHSQRQLSPGPTPRPVPAGAHRPDHRGRGGRPDDHAAGNGAEPRDRRTGGRARDRPPGRRWPGLRGTADDPGRRRARGSHGCRRASRHARGSPYPRRRLDDRGAARPHRPAPVSVLSSEKGSGRSALGRPAQRLRVQAAIPSPHRPAFNPLAGQRYRPHGPRGTRAASAARSCCRARSDVRSRRSTWPREARSRPRTRSTS